MAVYYRYRSGVDTFSLPVAGPCISVADLKRLIMGTSRHGHGRTRGRGPREGIAISDAQTGEEYADDSASVLRNSTVVVRRVAGPPAEAIVASPSIQRSKAQQEGDGSSSDSVLASTGTGDDEAKAISAMIDAAELKWEGPSRSYGHRGAASYNVPVPAPPAGYVCHRCLVPGHFIQHCPTNEDPRFDFGRCPMLAPAPAVPESNDDGVPADLRCKICKEVMVDAVVSSKCCFSSFCGRCIRAHIVGNSKCACGAKASADDLIPNPTLRTAISNILAAKANSASGGGNGTEKRRGSAASNASTPQTQTQSPAAAQESSSNSHVSSDKCAAVSEKHVDRNKSTSTSAAREPRKEHDTRSSHADHQYGYNAPFAPACYEPFFGGKQWSVDPSMCYAYGGMPYSYGDGYPVDAMGGNSNTTLPPPWRHGGSYGRKRTPSDCEDQSFKRRCGGGRSQVALILT